MRYEVRDPRRGNIIVAWYDGGEFWELDGPPYLWHSLDSKAPDIIAAVVDAHRALGRTVTEVPLLRQPA